MAKRGRPPKKKPKTQEFEEKKKEAGDSIFDSDNISMRKETNIDSKIKENAQEIEEDIKNQDMIINYLEGIKNLCFRVGIRYDDGDVNKMKSHLNQVELLDNKLKEEIDLIRTHIERIDRKTPQYDIVEISKQIDKMIEDVK